MGPARVEAYDGTDTLGVQPLAEYHLRAPRGTSPRGAVGHRIRNGTDR